MIDGETATISVSVGVTLCPNFQAVKLEAGIKFDTKTKNVKKAFAEAWDLCNAEVARNIPDAKETLANFDKLRTR